jgi:7-keto-8-aminopelargonate synthetase-like enzyme
MTAVTDVLASVETWIARGAEHGVLQRTLDSAPLGGRTICLEGRELVNFGSCSYLGLEVDTRVKRAAMEAIDRFGVHLSSSRTYLGLPLYEELEELLVTIFGGPVQLAPSTTLAHLSALPTLIRADDAVVFDLQVHHSVQCALHQVRAQRTHVECIRHNDMARLEDRVRTLRAKHRRVWYLADGVYSMYGDLAPMAELNRLKREYPELHLYIDDAHGVGWCGRNGRGHVLESLESRERAVVAASLGKAFGVGGGALIFPDEIAKQRVRNCGGPMIFSGPLPPAVLGGAIASARLHASGEVHELQAELLRRIRHANQLAVAHGLPLVSAGDVPIRFVGVGLPQVAYAMIARLMEEGFYLNAATYPAVAMRKSGLRLTLTCHQKLEDIEALFDAMARHLPRAFAENGVGVDDVRRDFKLVGRTKVSDLRELAPPPGLRLERATSVSELDADEWNRCLGRRGAFTTGGVAFLEAAFRGHAAVENNWAFRYYTVRDAAGVPVLMTFFTDAIWKDDTLSSAEVSRRVEEQRRSDPYFLTSRCLGMGSLLTEGDHLYLDRTRDWQGALGLLLEGLRQDQRISDARVLAFRDLPSGDAELERCLMAQGFAKFPMPKSLHVRVDWENERELVAKLSRRARRVVERDVLSRASSFEVQSFQKGMRLPSAELLGHFQRLYKKVKDKNLGLNTFDLPPDVFGRMLEHPEWVLSAMFLGDASAPPVAISADFVGNGLYVPTVIGLDYDYVLSHGTYRQMLYRALLRGKAYGASTVCLGMGATLEKERFGAVAVEQAIYVQTLDQENSEVLGHFGMGLAG